MFDHRTRLPGEADPSLHVSGLNELARAHYVPDNGRAERVIFHCACATNEWEALKETVRGAASRGEGVNFNVADNGHITLWGTQSLAWLEEQGVHFSRGNGHDVTFDGYGR